jgi:predicted permease
MVLVVTAALLARSLGNLDRAELGFDPNHVLMFKIDPTLNGYDPGRVRNLAVGIVDRLRGLPGVAGVTFSSHRLLANQSAIGVASTESETPPEPGSADARTYIQEHAVWRQIVGPDFFATLKLPLLRGRALDERDAPTGARTVVINRALAQRLFNTEDAVGRRVRLGLARTAPVYEVVGVAANARYTSVRDDMPPTAYLAATQHPMNTMTFAIRTQGNPERLVPAVREAVKGIDDQIPLVGIRTLSDQVAESLRQERLFSRLSLLLGAVTLALSAVGLYGLLAYGVALRIPEIGLRMALGAERRNVAWLVLRQSLTLAAIGLVAGSAAAMAGTTFVASMLYQLPARDPGTMLIAAAVMLGTCLLAGYAPARRAARVDPLVALRSE